MARTETRLAKCSRVLGPGGLALVLVAVNCWGQKASNWRVYRAVDGMPEAACVAVYFSPQGKILARHLNLPFLSELDGYRAVALAASPNSKGRVYQSPGGQLWTVVPSGLEEFRGGTWVSHPIADIARSAQTSMIDPVPLYAVRQDLVLFLLPDRLMEFNAEELAPTRTRVLRVVSETGLEKFTGMTPARKGGLWVSGFRGFARIPGPLRNLKPETLWTESLLPENLELQNLQQPVEAGTVETETENATVLTALAEGRSNQTRVAVMFDGNAWTVGKPHEQRLRHAWGGPDGTRWASAIDSLWQWPADSSDMVECDEVSARQYYDVAVEPGGAFWLATSDGLFRYAPLLWRNPNAARKLATPIRCLTGDQEKRLWFVSGSRLYALVDEKLQEYSLPQVEERNAQVRAMFLLKSGLLVLAVEGPESNPGDQLFTFQAARGLFAPAAPGAGLVSVLGMLKDGGLCVERTAVGAVGARPRLEVFDGLDFETFGDPPPATLGHLRCLFTTPGGDVWLGGDLGTACLRDHKWKEYVASDRSLPEGASCFAELPDGKIWCGTDDQIWGFDGRTWSVVRRGFDHINGLQRGKDGSIWVASNNGLHRFFREAWIENGLEDGLPSLAVRDLFANDRGLYAATSRGLSLFHPEADPETDAPRTYIQRLTEMGNNVAEGSTVFINFSGRDKWKYTARERLLYSYRLDDTDWSPYQELNRMAFTDLAPGRHYFQVRAMDRNCNVDSKPAQLEFVIVLPWYKEARLVAIGFAGAAAALFFGALAVNRHLRLLRSYAEIEKKVAERTQQLEAASRELAQSQKMTALGTLAAGVAHDFNNILSIIKGSAQIIEDNLTDPEKIKIRSDRIKLVVDQGAGIVKAMLGFSRDSGPADGPCDANDIVEETLRLLGDRFLREVTVERSLGEGLPQVCGAKEFIQQIVLNFLLNAAESMGPNKTIRVSTSVAERLPDAMILKPASNAGFVAISVTDTGCGIPAENLQRIFEPFFTTKALSTRRGTGLGLSMVYELAKKLAAGLAVESVVGQGSTFTLFLPVRQPDTGTTQ
ncbi:MAG TPA: ATP-binding protein [Verrucomicrobiae bacterium]